MKVKTFEMAVTQIYSSTRHCDTNDTDKVPMIKNLLGRVGFQFTKTLTVAEQVSCKHVKGLFDTQ